MRKYHVEKKFVACYSTAVEAESLEEAMKLALVDADAIPEGAYASKPIAESVEVKEALDENMQPLMTWDDDGNEVRYFGRCLKKERHEWVEESMNAFLEEGLRGSKEE